MKRSILVISILALLPVYAAAQKEKPVSNLGFSVEGGFSNLFLGTRQPSVAGKVSPFLGGGFGGALFYEMEYKHFLFRTGVGVDYSINNNRFASHDYTATIAEYPGLTYHYTFPRFMEQTNYGVGYIPVMIGGSFNKFFFLVGAKVGLISFAGSTRQRTTAKIWATDDDVVDPMEGLYTHQMQDYTFSGNKTKMSFAPLNVMGSVEVGLNLDSKLWKKSTEAEPQQTKGGKQKGKGRNAKRKPVDKADYYRKLHQKKSFKDCLHYRLSLFADYGINNIMPSNRPTEDLLAFNGVSDITPHSIYHLPQHSNAVLNNFMVGIKFAIMYEIPQKAPKKGEMANPCIVTFVRDEKTDKPLAGTSVTTQAVPAKGKKAKKPVVKTTDTKYGRVAKAYPPGEYVISASHAGYFPQEPFPYTHGNQYDTIRLALYPHQTLRSQIVDAKTGRAISAQVTVYDEEGKVVAQAQVDSARNNFSSVIDDRKPYSLCASAEGYRDTCMQVNGVNNVQTVALEPVHVKQFVLKNMFFATDKTKILASSEPALQELYTFLKNNPEIRIRIVGHTDDVGKEDYNQRLSEGRSASVKREMVTRGIDPKRMETAGHGETDPIVPNDTPEHRQMNRRVEIVILEGGK